MLFKRQICMVLILGSLSACLHISQRIHNIPIRASKSRVLKELGKPFKIQRKEGLDYWTYKFVLDGRHYTQTLIIKEGMMYKKEPLKPFSLRKF